MAPDDTSDKIYRILQTLQSINKSDTDTDTGRLFAYAYDAGDSQIKELALDAYRMFADKNALDFTVFRSAVFFEKEISHRLKKWLNAPESAMGVFTAGGTESIMIAALSAREHFKKQGKAGTPEILAPHTIHPSMSKAAFYLGMHIRKIPVDNEGKVHVLQLLQAITENTALIALSAPNWTYGTVDPISEISAVAASKGIPVHVDACMGGMVLPFLRMNDHPVPAFDFQIPGVQSISVDFHKFGYAPKGASMVLFRTAEYAAGCMYVDAHSPGYVLVNRAALSTRSVGHLAATYAVLEFIGEEGYKLYANQISETFQLFKKTFEKLGFQIAIPSVPIVLTAFNPNADIANFALNMKKKGWVLHVLKKYGNDVIPASIHLTINPVHNRVIDEFTCDATQALEEDSGIYISEIQKNPQLFIQKLITGDLDAMLIPLVIDYVPDHMATEVIKQKVSDWFKS
ncbi:aspartate aminotransferase family protein [Thermaurantimonas aggregans]|uniref:Aspartate aminotransferase family protein n=1 Tax=Thermaurantimonas aggregans TaxID=2173829 RepID=A0A401XMX9_9FLAO|nr:aspartate aminotransferase family protein [Thermaurantimonas aggregans]MCX8148142.1 aspartate aminotransferase family protein [Thermaurantimonas aggregans]GCD78369.1 aspartate aminotransferase family protein [Thermaurantimonas aggregans]